MSAHLWTEDTDLDPCKLGNYIYDLSIQLTPLKFALLVKRGLTATFLPT